MWQDSGGSAAVQEGCEAGHPRRCGERVTVTLRPGDFDTFVVIGHPDGQGGFSSIASDDDGAGGTDSELTTEIPAGGVLLIPANSLSAGQTGRYTIAIRTSG